LQVEASEEIRMKSRKIIGPWLFPVVCIVLFIDLGIGRAQCTRSCGTPLAPTSLVPLYEFTGMPDGTNPQGDLLLDSSGNLYGTTSAGGAVGLGTIFKLDATGTETVLYSFTGAPDGATPGGDLVQDSSGNLYGTTSQGGAGGCGESTSGNPPPPNSKQIGCGTIFRLDATGKETILHTFTGTADGAVPVGGLVLDPSGNLYGTTTQGGANNAGVVFKVDSSGQETVLYSFNGAPDGVHPMGGLLLDSSGNLYGTTFVGGAHGAGTVFKLDNANNETLLYSFGGPDGASPQSGLVLDALGNLYGSTSQGGQGHCKTENPAFKPEVIGCGVVYKLDAIGNETVLINFGGLQGGAFPLDRLLLDAAGNLYGTTSQGGLGGCVVSNGEPGGSEQIGCGTIFELDATGSATTLYSFQLSGGGIFPSSGLIADAESNLYGTTYQGGTAQDGEVYEFTAFNFSLTAASASLAVQYGAQVADVITIAPQNGAISNPVQLSCAVTGSTPAATCALSSMSVTPGANSATSTLTFTAPSQSAELLPSNFGNFDGSRYAAFLPVSALSLIGLLLAKIISKHRRLWLLCSLPLAFVSLLAGCAGGSSTQQTQPLNYTVTVTATSGRIQHTTQILVTVQ
jgi:uncharacterized repeat protein (TIGR03803 family)